MLVVRPDHVGDILLLTPALRELRAGLPAAEVSVLVGAWSEPVLRRNPRIDAILTWDFPWFNRRPTRGFPGGTASNLASLFALARLLRGRFDAAIIARYDHWWGALACAIAGIPVRIGYDTPETRPFLTHALLRQGRQHEAVRNVALVRALLRAAGEPGTPIRSAATDQHEWAPLEFVISEAEQDEAMRLLEAEGIDPRVSFAVLHPGAGAWPKQWTGRAFAVVGDALADRHGVRILISGTASEVSLVREIADEMRHAPIVLAGRTSLGVLGAVYRQARVVVGVDSGPLHLAVAVGTPSVTLYGPVDPALFGPYGDPNRHVVVRSGLPCSPCDRLDWPFSTFAEHPCVRDISPAVVLKAVDRVLRQAPPLPASPPPLPTLGTRAVAERED